MGKFFTPNKTIYAGTVNGKKTYSHTPTSGVHVVRYADDFIITAHSREKLENEILPAVKLFMADRGLELSLEKTKITHIEEGFDFLGWNVRKYEGKLLTKPSKNNVKAFLNKIREIIKNGKTRKQADLIKTLNPIINGWANYHKVAVSTDAFSGAGREIFKSLWKWARRRHPQKGARWVREKYFKTVKARNWVFRTTEIYKGKMTTYSLADVAGYKIIRHVKIKSDANPYDPKWESYFEGRIAYKMTNSLSGKKSLLALWRTQKGTCPLCNQKITAECMWITHHILPRSQGGSDLNSNLMLLHDNCHRKHHSVNGLSTGPLTRA